MCNWNTILGFLIAAPIIILMWILLAGIIYEILKYGGIL